ncbi:MAG: hypothetical protein JWN04_1149 [Myxococcaceae bacterium]|nr:hypothetical protein [Myxococcaceae bacterium]
MPLSTEGPTRTFRQNVTVAVLLAAVAGEVNAVGFVLLGRHTSHMTGQVAAAGEALAHGDTTVALQALKLVSAFVLGAATAAALLDLTRARRSRYTAVLALEALVLAASSVCAIRSETQLVALPLALCFAMGLQNAIVTRISGAVVRTTHLTGVLTDFGMECVRVIRWFFGARGERVGHARLAQLERASLHVALVVSFLGGATVGPVLLHYVGGLALGAPVLLLLALVIVDWRASHA